MPAIRDSLRAVARYRNSLKVDLYYGLEILPTRLRFSVKKMLTKRFMHRARKLQ
jgi:hypothetical protein